MDKKKLLQKLKILFEMKEVKEGFPSQQTCFDWVNKVAPLLKFNQQYYVNFMQKAYLLNLNLSTYTLVPAFNIMVSQLHMAINDLENAEEEVNKTEYIRNHQSGIDLQLKSSPDVRLAECKDSEFVFRKEGDIWKIVYKGEKLPPLPHRKGYYYIEYLLTRPNVFVAAHVISTIFNTKNFTPSDENYSRMNAEELDCEGLAFSDLENKRVKPDRKAEREYKETLNKLIKDKDTSIKNGDPPETIAEYDKEIGLYKNLLNATKLSITASTKDFKARVSVTNNINRAIKKIKEHNDKLSEYLKNNIKKGNTLIYTPELSNQIYWNI